MRNPATLGVLPLIPLAIGAAAIGSIIATGQAWRAGVDYSNWKETVKPPLPGPTPAAPQTADQLRTWTPENQAAADQWKYAAHYAGGRAIPGGPLEPVDDSLLIAALLVAGISTFVWFTR